MRITAAQAKRLGISLGKKDSEKIPERRTKGRTRLPRASFVLPAVSFTVELPFDPKPKERPRTVSDKEVLRSAFLASKGSVGAFMKAIEGKISRTYTPKATADYEGLIAMAATAAMRGREQFTCPVETSLCFTLSGDPEVWPTSRLDGDADNLEKAVLDALNGIVFEDDRLVVRSYREKRCGAKPMIEITVRPAEPAVNGRSQVCPAASSS